MRSISLLVMLTSGLLIVPSALAAMVAPFGLGSEQPLYRLVLSVVLIMDPIMFLIAGFGAFFAFEDRRRMKSVPLSLFLVAAASTANFWAGAL